ncbi:hypothetical protein Bealeia1_00456 [Candidatus Bealeia paramacronuclearis]|uniref:Uncharacterized protein n=1 Tax=Candidatus Bealeia paramacronuclearis TaxID=1921001 RepID=A0ABZ2C1M0_9PROT|nr:hypothetical protein [Candidatus Bealeia paramacronuclearis]
MLSNLFQKKLLMSAALAVLICSPVYGMIQDDSDDDDGKFPSSIPSKKLDNGNTYISAKQRLQSCLKNFNDVNKTSLPNLLSKAEIGDTESIQKIAFFQTQLSRLELLGYKPQGSKKDKTISKLNEFFEKNNNRVQKIFSTKLEEENNQYKKAQTLPNPQPLTFLATDGFRLEVINIAHEMWKQTKQSISENLKSYGTSVLEKIKIGTDEDKKNSLYLEKIVEILEDEFGA